MSVARRDIVVVGASSGGLDAITQLVCGLPADLRAAVLVVIHMAPTFPPGLAERLSRMGALEVADAVDGEVIRPNRVYLCIPDRHLLIDSENIRLSRGPKENHARPSIDALFRSAAYSAGPRTIGVVLTGRLDDGTAGLWAIKDRGGIAIVQDPNEALYPSMPQSAARQVSIDYTLGMADMGVVLAGLTREEVAMTKQSESESRGLEIETAIALGRSAIDSGIRDLGEPSIFTCPECHGTMFTVREGPGGRFRCHTGHAYTAQSLAEHSLPALEKSLWTALAQLEEREVLLRQLGESDAEYARLAELTHQLRVKVRGLLDDPAMSRNQ
jgi:two-component system, chemotaxis family, protein-glutamate methylesterase/glutaminase